MIMNDLQTSDFQQQALAITRQAMATPAQRRIDEALPELRALPQVECPLIHRFTPGMYIREIFMPKGTFIISQIHKTEHPFVVTVGRVKVWIEDKGVEEIAAPYVGITKPGTRRILEIIEDCRWITFHPTNATTVEDAERDVIYNPERDGKEPNNGVS